MQKLAQIRQPLLSEIMLSITALGSITATLIILIFLYRQKEKDSFQNLGIGILTTSIIVYTVKHIVNRPRPETIMPEVIVSTQSFPSGHTATAFLTATILAEKLDSKIIYSVAGAVGISRIYIGAHYPSDVITGAAIGTIIGKIVIDKGKFQTKVSKTISSIFSEA